MPQLDPTWFASQLFWLAITLLVLHVLLSRAILPPLVGVLDKRTSTRRGDLEAAEKFRQEAESAKAEYEQVLNEARERAQQIYADAELKNKQSSEKALADLATKTKQQIDNAESRIAKQKQEILDSMKDETISLVSEVVSKVTHGDADEIAVKEAVRKLSRAS